jgi:hypothetical protein
VKRLYLSTYHRALAVYDECDEARFETGQQVGLLATQRFPGGVLVPYNPDRVEEALERTRALMADPKVPAIFEATFIHERVLVRADILERLPDNAWRIVEVKSSTEMEPHHVPDVAIQCYVTRGAGLDVPSAHLWHINNRYVYDGVQLDLRRYFSRQDITEQVEGWQADIPDLIADQLRILAGPLPSIEPGLHCDEPYGCAFWQHCTADKPTDWIFKMPGKNAIFETLLARGIEQIARIPDDFPLNRLQRRVRKCVISGCPFLDPALAETIGIGRYPVHYLDFETLMPAVPLFAGTRPFQQIPFQWSVQTLRSEGAQPEERAYLHSDGADPRRGLAAALLEALREPGPIYIYTWFESGIIKGLADALPDLAGALLALRARLVDLCWPIRNSYYHPRLNGSFTLKNLAPALLPEMDYAGLEIREGSQAGPAYLRTIAPDTPPEERDRIRRALLAYCGQDTLALLGVHRTLLSLAADPSE